MTQAANLRARAEAEAAALPALLLAAERLAATLAPGAHGLRRAGTGEEFWQYRPAQPGESAAAIDWRRSARSDSAFVRDRERVSPQAAALWVSDAPGMAWTGAPERETKRDRARLLTLALAAALLRGGERVGLLGAMPRAGRTQLPLLAQALLSDGGDTPDPAGLRPAQRVVLFDDCLGAPDGIEALIAQAAAMGVGGVLMQVLDPMEEEFPFSGAVLFRAPGIAGLHHDTRDAGGLRDAYRARLAERRARLAASCAAGGWLFGTTSTGAVPSEGLLWLATALEG